MDKKKKEQELKKEIRKEKLWSKEIYGIAILLAALLAILLFVNSLYPTLLWDENVYLGNARSHISESKFTEDFRFPLLEYIIAGTWAFTGESVFIARIVMILFTLATVLILYHVSKRYFSWKMSLLLCSLFSLTALILGWGFRIYADIPAMFFTLLSFHFILKDHEKEKDNKKLKWLALAGISFALAFLARFSSALFLGAVLIYFLIKKKPKKILLLLLFMLIALLPWLIYNTTVYGNPVWDLIEQGRAVIQYTYSEPIIKQIVNLFSFTNILIPVLMLIGFYPLFKKNEKMNLSVLIFLVLSFIFYLFIIKLKDARYYLSFLPFIYLAAFQGLVFLRNINKTVKNIRIFRLVAIIIIFLLIAAQLGHLFNFYKLTENVNNCEKKSSTMLAIDYLKYKVGGNDVILGNNWPWLGYYLNVKAYSLYNSNIDVMIFQHNPKYVIYNPTMGIPYNQNILDSSKFLVPEKEFQGNCEKTLIYRVVK